MYDLTIPDLTSQAIPQPTSLELLVPIARLEHRLILIKLSLVRLQGRKAEQTKAWVPRGPVTKPILIVFQIKNFEIMKMIFKSLKS